MDTKVTAIELESETTLLEKTSSVITYLHKNLTTNAALVATDIWKEFSNGSGYVTAISTESKPLTVMFMGHSQEGKSSLINAVSGRCISPMGQPGGEPTTKSVFTYRIPGVFNAIDTVGFEVTDSEVRKQEITDFLRDAMDEHLPQFIVYVQRLSTFVQKPDFLKEFVLFCQMPDISARIALNDVKVVLVMTYADEFLNPPQGILDNWTWTSDGFIEAVDNMSQRVLDKYREIAKQNRGHQQSYVEPPLFAVACKGVYDPETKYLIANHARTAVWNVGRLVNWFKDNASAEYVMNITVLNLPFADKVDYCEALIDRIAFQVAVATALPVPGTRLMYGGALQYILVKAIARIGEQVDSFSYRSFIAWIGAASWITEVAKSTAMVAVKGSGYLLGVVTFGVTTAAAAAVGAAMAKDAYCSTYAVGRAAIECYLTIPRAMKTTGVQLEDEEIVRRIRVAYRKGYDHAWSMPATRFDFANASKTPTATNMERQPSVTSQFIDYLATWTPVMLRSRSTSRTREPAEE
ncbi:hypothetical protein HDU84_009864 [Entophlyctis sp. JEL0112]|nr:hypothetical protein HDU84_009864 [Entophlyctis sp. JEL0112]